jgi:hypothetical protein
MGGEGESNRASPRSAKLNTGELKWNDEVHNCFAPLADHYPLCLFLTPIALLLR